MKKAYKHQARFLKSNPNKALLLHETGTGKSLIACRWLNLRPEREALIICPKPIMKKWLRDLEEENVVADIMSTDEIKKYDISTYQAIVIDEAHNLASPLFSKARSQRATVLYNHVKKNKDTHILLLTATPVKSTPWNIHTLGAYIGRFWPVPEFRSKFEKMVDRYGRWHYELNPTWRTDVRAYVEEIADIVLLKDCADIPTQHTQVINVPWKAAQEKELQKKYTEPSKAWHERHRAENGLEKLAKLKELTDGYRKVVVVAYYTSQIEEYAKEIGKERAVYILQGSTKNPDKVIQSARAADDCVFFVQASMSNGWDASEFSVMIFASQSFKFIDNVQSRGRILRMNNLHENIYIYLIGGKNDQAVYDRICLGSDFHPPSYM